MKNNAILSKNEFVSLFLNADEETQNFVLEILLNPQSLSIDELKKKADNFLQERKEN